jgi:hypothetical protein
MPYISDPMWFAPSNVIYHLSLLRDRLSPEARESKAFKKAEEMCHVAIMLVGLQKVQGRKYWLQMVDDNEGSPDVRTGILVSRAGEGASDEMKTQDVEVVTYGQNSTESLVEFLVTTKLSPARRAYDEKTTVLCAIQRDTRLPPLTECRDAIAQLGVRHPVMIVGRVSNDPEVYRIAQISPTVDFEVGFDVVEAIKEQGHTGVLTVKRGTKRVWEHRPDERHLPFEKLGF